MSASNNQPWRSIRSAGLSLLFAIILSCSDEPVKPLAGTITINGNEFAISNGEAISTTQGVELHLGSSEMEVTIWIAEVANGKYTITDTYTQWRYSSSANLRQQGDVQYATNGEIDMTLSNGSLSGSVLFKVRNPLGSTDTEVAAEWDNARVRTNQPSTCLISRIQQEGSITIDFEYNKDGQLTHATAYDTAGYLYDKYITYLGGMPVEILTLEKDALFYYDSIGYTYDDRVDKIYVRQNNNYLYVYAFEYNANVNVSSINMKQYFADEMVDEWTETYTYDSNGNQERPGASLQFDDKKNPMQLIQHSLGGNSALPWLFPSEWHIGLWNVNGINNILSIDDGGDPVTYSYMYGPHGFPHQITMDDVTLKITYDHCGIQ